VYVYDQNDYPERIPLVVTPSFISRTEPAQVGKFLGFYTRREDGTFGFVVIPDSPFLKLANQKFQPLTNSAAGPLESTPSVPIIFPAYRCEWYKENFVDYSSYINKINSSPFYLESFDRVEQEHLQDLPDRMFEKMFDTQTLVCNDVQVDVVRMRERNVYRYMVEFIEAGVYYLVDNGLEESKENGDDDNRGGTFDNTEIPSGENRAQKVTNLEQDYGTHHVLLDGKGKRLKSRDPEDAIWMKWVLHESADFNQMNIGNPF
jgi:hypothetical protein